LLSIGASRQAISNKKSQFSHPIPTNDFRLSSGSQLLLHPNHAEKCIPMMVATVPYCQFCCLPLKTTSLTPKQAENLGQYCTEKVHLLLKNPFQMETIPLIPSKSHSNPIQIPTMRMPQLIVVFDAVVWHV
jgi:hypothetical protein